MQTKYIVKENYSEPLNFYAPLTNAAKAHFLKIRKIKEIAKIVLYFVCIAILAWLFFSFVDIVMHNTTTCQYAWWNVFMLF